MTVFRKRVKLHFVCVPEREAQLANSFSDIPWSQLLAFLADVIINLNKFKL